MNRLIKTMVKLAIFKSDFDYHLTRASLVFVAFFFGYQKWFQYVPNRMHSGGWPSKIISFCGGGQFPKADLAQVLLGW